MEDKNSETGGEFMPGTTITPSAMPTAPAPRQASAAPLPSAAPAAQPPTPVPAVPQAVEPALPESQPAASGTTPTDDAETITWTASEFIDHAKSIDWYLALACAAILAAVALYVGFHDVILSATILVVALTLGYYGRRQPRQLEYRLDIHGLTIGQKYFPYELFRSFAVVDEGPFASIVFLPMKRFGLLTTIYFDPQDEDRILDLISEFLPFEPHKRDALDNFMKRIRF